MTRDSTNISIDHKTLPNDAIYTSTMCSTYFAVGVPTVETATGLHNGRHSVDKKARIYIMRGEPYLCSAKAPVLDGSGSRR